MKKITTREIAKLAGVSPAAVSLALNGKKGIGEDTRKSILKIAKELDYTPKTSIKDEKIHPKPTNNIAVLFRSNLNTIDQFFYNELNTNIMQACKNSQYNLIFTSTCDTPALPEIMSSRNVDGIIIYGDVNTLTMEKIEELNIPFITLDSSRLPDSHLAIRVDYDNAAYLCTKHLIELGHRDIGFIGNDNMHDFNVLTFNGFQRATIENQLTLGMNRIQISVYGEDSLYNSIDNALAGSNMPTALFCTTDFYAILAIRYLHKKGLRVPDDISVIGIDNITISKYTIPALTTFDIDCELMVQKGLELLFKKMNGEESQSITLPTGHLIVRESTAPPALIY